MRRFAIVFLLLGGCGPKSVERLDSIFESARADLQAGELEKALTACERGITLAGHHRDLPFQWKFRLLRAEALLHNLRAEEVLRQLAETVPARPEYASLAARKKMLEGQAHSVLGHSDESDGLLAEALREATDLKAMDVVADTAIFRGAVLFHRDRLDDAEQSLRIGLNGARAMHSDYLEAGALVNLGMIRLKKHRYDEAIAYFEQASEKSREQAQTLYALAQNNLAVCYLNLGEPDRAINVQKASVARYERSGEKVYLEGALGATGESYLSKGELKAAIPYLQRALGLASELSRTKDAALWATNLSSVHIELGDWPNAETFNQEAIRLKRSGKDSTLQYNTLNAANIAAGKGELEEATRLYAQALADGKDDPAVLWEAHGARAMLEWKRHRSAEANREFEAAIEVLEKTRSDVTRTEFKLPFLSPRIRLYQAYVDALLGQGQTERALAVADSSRAQVLAQRAGSGPVRRLPPNAFLDLARRSGAVLLSYWLAPTQSHVWVVTPRDVHHVTLPGAGEIEPLVRQYQQALEQQLADPLRTRLAAGDKLYEMLVAPVRSYLSAGTRVVVVPDGVLHGVNLEALTVSGRYLIQDLTFEIAPSLALWGAPSGRPAGRRILLLGDPITRDPNFPALAHAASEIAGVRQSFAPPDQVVLTRDSATPQAFLAAAGGPFAAIHFTAHAVANRESPLESAVVLSGGKLYARDVMDLPLQADLVTVSACRGAGQRAYSGEGLVGFAWAFLRAGARNVIAGLWDVNDQSTAGLMDVLYRELAAGRRPADALRTAKLGMIESRGNLKKPYYWAPFQLYTVAP